MWKCTTFLILTCKAKPWWSPPTPLPPRLLHGLPGLSQLLTFFLVLLSRGPTPCPSFHPIFLSSSTPTDIFTGTTRSCSGGAPGITPSETSEFTIRLRRFWSSLPCDKNSSFVAILLGAIPNSPISSSSIKSSGLCCLCSPFLEREETKVEGCQPSFVPTVLKYPAEKPPVKAPWNRLLPSASVTTCSCIGIAFLRGASSSKGSNGVPKLASVSSSSLAAILTFSSPEPLGFTHHYEWLWLQPKIRIFSLANETQCALGIKLQSTAHFRRVINCNVVIFKNQRVYKRTCFSFEHFERRWFISEENMLSL